VTELPAARNALAISDPINPVPPSTRTRSGRAFWVIDVLITPLSDDPEPAELFTTRLGGVLDNFPTP
jgi:hypothetical protein